MRVESWADHAVLWQVYPLGFTGAERSALPANEPVRHRLRQLEAWLDYAVGLGCNGLLLGPVFASEPTATTRPTTSPSTLGSATRATSTRWSPPPTCAACG